MCFSAQASFTTAALIGAIGAASVVRAKPRFRILAFSPLFFAFQQAMEGIVWHTLELGDSISLLHKISMYLFMIFATLFWPLWIPSILYSVEKNPISKSWLRINIGIGCLVAIFSGLGFLLLGYKAEIIDYHIHYIHVVQFLPYLPSSLLTALSYIVFILYLLATVGSFFISTLRGAWLLGIVLIASWAVSLISFATSFISMWCFFGAWASIIMFLIVKK